MNEAGSVTAVANKCALDLAFDTVSPSVPESLKRRSLYPP